MRRRREGRGAGGWRRYLAYGAIYLIWGTTYLAIRIDVREIPPLVCAGMRFIAAGLVVLGWTRARGDRGPTGREWLGCILLGFTIFAVSYGLVFWAETRVASGTAAIMSSTIPLFMAITESALNRQAFTRSATGALVLGLCGVVTLMSPSLSLHERPLDVTGAMALLCAPAIWSVSSVLMPLIPLPSSKVTSAGGQMLSGGVWLMLLAIVFHEPRRFHPFTISTTAWWCLAYLILGGSIIAFTAYVWLIHREPAIRVGTYAYVNPLVAIAVGYTLGGETLGTRTALGAACILLSVVLVLRAPARQQQV